ncbi:hypothetical protein F4805DRAFT_456464 [Annulohypoxylon moriforme]|nr:hypothetical protein F4805DRAFT_456464 [Annulohypoxylon moriforme]
MVASKLPSSSDSRWVSPRLSPPVEESSHMLDVPREQRRSASEPVSPRASFGDLKAQNARHRDGSMTCFPKLPSRTSTTDWLTPLGLFGESNMSQHKATMSDLYVLGIDAHSGADVPKPLEVLEESPPPTLAPIDDFLFQCSGPQWPTQVDEQSNTHLRVGSAIGASTHRRKSSFKPLEAPKPHQNHGLLDTLRRYSFMPLSDQTPENIREASPPARTWTDLPLREDAGRKHSSKDLLQEILDRKPASKRSSRRSSRKPSHIRIDIQSRSRTGTGSSRRSGRDRVSCSEDQTPHICMDEQLTPLGSDTAWFECIGEHLYRFHCPAFSTPRDTLSAPFWTPVPTDPRASPTGFPAEPVALVTVSPSPRPAAPTMLPVVLPTPPATLPTVLVTNLAAPVTPEDWELFSRGMLEVVV